MITAIPALMVTTLEVKPAPPLRLLPFLVLLLVNLALLAPHLFVPGLVVRHLDAVGTG